MPKKNSSNTINPKSNSQTNNPNNTSNAVENKLKRAYSRHRNSILEHENLAAFSNPIYIEAPPAFNSNNKENNVSSIKASPIPTPNRLHIGASIPSGRFLNSTSQRLNIAKIHKVFHNTINSVNLDLLKVFLRYCNLPVYGIELKNYVELINDLDLGIHEQNRSYTPEITEVFKQYGLKEGRTHFIFFENFTESLKSLYKVLTQDRITFLRNSRNDESGHKVNINAPYSNSTAMVNYPKIANRFRALYDPQTLIMKIHSSNPAFWKQLSSGTQAYKKLNNELSNFNLKNFDNSLQPIYTFYFQ